MGLFSTITTALGLRRAIRVRQRVPLGLTNAARRKLDSLEKTSFIRLRTQRAPDGLFTLHVEPCPEAGLGQSPHPKLHISADDVERLVGLRLDYADPHWRLKAHLRVDADETPNPNGRKYLTDQFFHQGQPAFFADATSAPPLARHLLDSPHVQTVLFHEHTIVVERTPDADWNTIDRDIDTRLRQALLRCAPVIQSAPSVHFDDPFVQEVWEFIQKEVIPPIRRDGGDLQLLEIENGVVRVTLTGACATCPASTLTLKGGIEHKLVAQFPGEIVSVVAI